MDRAIGSGRQLGPGRRRASLRFGPGAAIRYSPYRPQAGIHAYRRIALEIFYLAKLQ